MEQKFRKGDIVKLRSGGDNMMVSGYKVNYTGGAINAILGTKKYDDQVTTSLVLCEWMVKSKVNRNYFDESNLVLVEPMAE